jgi:enoyl-CoA hydratase/carnithine racemase
MTSTPDDSLLVTRDGHVAVLTLHRPQAMNAINLALRAALYDTLDALRHDPGVRVVVLTGAGEKAFSAGMDLREFAQIMADTPLSEMRRFRWEKGDGIAQFDKPIIAAVNGLAIGGGVELALLCDICFAAQGATFAFAEVTRGLIPGNGGTQRLARRVGQSRALEMILSGRTVNADEALDMGLVDHVVSPDQLLAQARALAQQIAANAPVAVRMAKAAVTRGADLSLADGLQLERDLATFVYTTEDAKEGPQAFVQKRPPQWHDR